MASFHCIYKWRKFENADSNILQKLIVFKVILAFLDHLKPNIIFGGQPWWTTLSATRFQYVWIRHCVRKFLLHSTHLNSFSFVFSILPSLNLYSLINFDFIWHLPHCWVLTPRYIHKFSLFSSASKETYITENIVLRSYWLYVLLFDLARKQCNGIITVSLSEMSESERRFLVNNILMFRSVLCLVTSHFCLKLPTPPPPCLKGDVICVLHLITRIFL